MKNSRIGLRAALSVFALAGALVAQTAISNEDVIKLSGAGLSEEFILGQVNQNGAQLQSDAASLAKLKRAGVGDKVLMAIVRKSPPQMALTSESVRELGAAGFGEPLLLELIDTAPGKYATDASRLIELKRAGVSDGVLRAMIRKTPPAEPLTADAVARLHQAQFTDDFLIELVQQQPGQFAMPADKIVALKQAGISERVITAMMGRTGGEIPADTEVQVRLIDPIDSEKAKPGDTFAASIAEALVVNGREVAPRGADATVVLQEEKEAGRLTGTTQLTIALQSITVQGKPVTLQSSVIEEKSGSQTKSTATRAGVLGGIGAAIGAIAGGGKGAAIGAGAGAAAGAGSVLLTKGARVNLPSETLLTFKLSNAVQY